MGVDILHVLGGEYLVQISLTDVTTTTEVRIDLPFRKGRIMRQKAILQSGDASTLEPLISRRPNAGGTLDVEMRVTAIGTDADPALPGVVDEQPNDPVLFYAAATVAGQPQLETGTGRLWYRPQPDAGTNNAIDAELVLRAGWP